MQHGENATKSVALESAGPDFLAASPLAAVVDAGFFRGGTRERRAQLQRLLSRSFSARFG